MNDKKELLAGCLLQLLILAASVFGYIWLARPCKPTFRH